MTETRATHRAVHFIGIGGYGMSGLAQVLHAAGVAVTGSDEKESDRTRRLAALGVPVTIGHRAENVGAATEVIHSTDVPETNPELAAARARGLPVRHRSELLADIVHGGRGIAISGTHGKTTTTTMVAACLLGCGLDPTVLIGGEADILGGGTGRYGRGGWVVAEADESDGSFLRYRPEIAVVTSVEPEHLEYYGHDFARLEAAFRQWLAQVGPDGLVVVSADDARLVAMSRGIDAEVVTYGLSPAADLRAADVTVNGLGSRFRVEQRGRDLGTVTLAAPGQHNVLNALAALAVAMRCGVPFAEAAAALATFTNARRRFEVIAKAGGITVVDDYAHHPTEIQATLQAARVVAAGRVLAVFQPQRYTRTQNLFSEFTAAFRGADVLFLTDIYSPPGERPLPGVSAAALAEQIEAHDGRPVTVLSDKGALVERFLELAQPGDVVLTMGAGDIWQVAHELGRRLAVRHGSSGVLGGVSGA